MGLIKGVLKLVLSIVLVLAVLTLVFSYSITKTLSKENFVKEATAQFSENAEINSHLGGLYNNASVYFNKTNASEINVPFSPKENVTLFREKFKMAYPDFKQSIVSELAEKAYENTPVPAIYSQAAKFKSVSLTVILVTLLAMILLFSGRFMLLGINLLAASVFYFPTKFIYNRFVMPGLLKNIPQNGLALNEFVQGFASSIFLTSQKLLIYLAISGVVCIIIAFLLKIFKIGLWFQGFFESKSKEK